MLKSNLVGLIQVVQQIQNLKFFVVRQNQQLQHIDLTHQVGLP